MGSMSEDCRIRMEIEATEEVIRFLDNGLLANEVPEQEFFCVRHETNMSSICVIGGAGFSVHKCVEA